jgi:hypothetical protein
MTAQRLPLGHHVVIFTSDATGVLKAWHVHEQHVVSTMDNTHKPSPGDDDTVERGVEDDEPLDLELEPLAELSVHSRVTCMASTNGAKRKAGLKSIMKQASLLIAPKDLVKAAQKNEEELIKRTRVGPKPKKPKGTKKEFLTVTAETTEGQAEAAMTQGLPEPEAVERPTPSQEAIAINEKALASTSKPKPKGKKKKKKSKNSTSNPNPSEA